MAEALALNMHEQLDVFENGEDIARDELKEFASLVGTDAPSVRIWQKRIEDIMLESRTSHLLTRNLILRCIPPVNFPRDQIISGAAETQLESIEDGTIKDRADCVRCAAGVSQKQADAAFRCYFSLRESTDPMREYRYSACLQKAARQPGLAMPVRAVHERTLAAERDLPCKGITDFRFLQGCLARCMKQDPDYCESAAHQTCDRFMQQATESGSADLVFASEDCKVKSLDSCKRQVFDQCRSACQ
ncbi:MAG: hypothetical protein WA005_06555 [Candidatus Binataceae bacterium]